MSRENIAAYTAPGTTYPEYVSVNKEEDGRVSVTVRGPAVETDGGLVEGKQATMHFPSMMAYMAAMLPATSD